jgi:hypothetical protein
MRLPGGRTFRFGNVRPLQAGLIGAGLFGLVYLSVCGIENRGDACGAALTAALVGLVAALATRRPKPSAETLRSSRA